MRPLKIGVFTDRLSPGAMPKFVGGLVRNLRDMGYDAEALCIMDTGLPEGHHQFEEYLGDIPFRYLSREHPILRRFDFTIPPFSFFSAFDVVAKFAMPRYLKNDTPRYDLLVAQSSISCWIANKVWHSLGIPYVAALWDPISFIIDDVYKKKLPKPLFSLAMRFGTSIDKHIIDDALVALCASNGHVEVIKRYTDRTVEVVYPGAEVADSIPDQRGDYLVTLDRWDVGNMPNWLLDVLAGLSKPVNLKVAGFWWPEKLQADFLGVARERGLEDQIEMVGSVSEARLIELFAGARALIYPHKTPISLVLMEAAANGCPTVMQAPVDLFTHGVNGFFPNIGVGGTEKGHRLDTHRPEDLTEFIECTERLISDERFAWEMGKDAWELMKSYSWRAHAEKIAALIEEHMPVADPRS